MSFCTQCGSKQKDGVQFCTNCGHKLAGNDNHNNSSKQSRTTRTNKKESPSFWSKWTKKQKIIASSVGGFIILLVASYFLINFLLDRDRTISAFEEAINNENTKKVAEMLSSTDEKLEITEKTIQPFVTWLSENPDELEGVIESLKGQSKGLDKKKTELNIDSEYTSEDMVVLQQEEKRFLRLFKQYKLAIVPVYMELSAPYEQTTFFVNDKEIGKLSSNEEVIKVGPFLPGPNTVTAKLVTDYIDLESNKDVELRPGDSSNYIYFDMEADEVSVSTDMDNLQTTAELLINNEPMEWNLGEDHFFGPVLLDGSTNVALKLFFPWGEVTTAEKVVESNNIYFNIKEEEEIKNIVVEQSEKALTSYLQVKASNSIENVEGLTDAASEHLLQLIESDEMNTQWKTSKPLYFDIYPESYNLYVDNGVYKISSVARITEEVEYIDYVEENSTILDLEFMYDEKAEEWKTSSVNFSNTYLFDEPEKHEFSYEDTFENKNYQEELSVELISLVQDQYSNYVYGLVEAINENDFNLVKNYMKKDSELYRAQKELVKKLSKDGIKEEIFDFQINNISRDGDNITIEAYEAIYVIYEDALPELTENNWIYTGVIEDGTFKLTSIAQK